MNYQFSILMHLLHYIIRGYYAAVNDKAFCHTTNKVCRTVYKTFRTKQKRRTFFLLLSVGRYLGRQGQNTVNARKTLSNFFGISMTKKVQQ